MWRISFVFACLLLFFAAILVRLFYWQIWSGTELRVEAAAQHISRFTIPAERGSILSSDGSPLAMNRPAFLVYAEPKQIKDLPSFIRTVSGGLGLTEASVSAMFADAGTDWVPIKHRVESKMTEELKRQNIPGLGFEKEPKRYYPEASMAAQLLGFVGQDQNGDDRGYFGLEGYYDRELRGKSGSLTIEKDVTGAPILVGEATRINPEDGRSLVLWLDRTVQSIVEQKLAWGIGRYGAKSGSITVMDPKTGGILASAGWPSYDPSSYADFDKELFKNPGVADTYEPGSTFKPLVMGLGIDENVITPKTSEVESGPVNVSGYLIRTWNNAYLGTMTMTDVLIHSSNVGMVFVQNKLGREKLIRGIRAFGFGKSTGIDLEDESSPALRSDDEWKEIDLATASFGQGIAVTPLQMLRAIGAIANNGMLMEPHVVKEIREPDGKVVPIPPKKVRQVIHPAAARETTEMMVTAVDEGEAKFAKPKGYRIAGKTGTAQIPVEGHYDNAKTIASFVGFAPADDPKFVMLVTLREPTSSQWGSETAAPLFFAIAKELFLYYGIPAK